MEVCVLRRQASVESGVVYICRTVSESNLSKTISTSVRPDTRSLPW